MQNEASSFKPSNFRPDHIASEIMFKRSSPLPRVYPTDDVIQLASNDDKWLQRQLSFLACIYFEEVLDPEKLYNALEAVLSSSREWSYLAGRLRLDPKVRTNSSR